MRITQAFLVFAHLKFVWLLGVQQATSHGEFLHIAVVAAILRFSCLSRWIQEGIANDWRWCGDTEDAAMDHSARMAW
jgi:hypothetical protein